VDLKRKIRKLARENDIDLIGFSSVGRLKSAPSGKRPTDLLGEAKTVISLGIGIRRGVREANIKAYGGLRSAIYVYMVYGYEILNTLLNQCAFRITKLLEEQRLVAMPIPASPPTDYMRLMGVFSNRHAAVASGLGNFGWQSVLLTPQFGPRLRLTSIVTNAEIEADPLFSETLCRGEKCRICSAVCPVKAIPPDDGVELEIGGTPYRYAKIDKWRCRIAEQGHTRKTLGYTEYEGEGEVNPEIYLERLKEENPWQKLERKGSYCGQCIIRCPVGL
jgi:epoxyqueuosine reductase